MKVILYMAITANGFIAKENDDTGFVSKTEWKNFRSMINKTQTMVIGRRTYEIMQNNNEFSGLKNIKIFVLTHNTLLKSNNSNITFSNQQPRAILESLKRQGSKNVLIAGGGTVNASFMKENLVDEIYLDIEPALFGNGIKLFADGDFEARLKLLGTKKLSKNEVQLHYKVIKKQ